MPDASSGYTQVVIHLELSFSGRCQAVGRDAPDGGLFRVISAKIFGGYICRIERVEYFVLIDFIETVDMFQLPRSSSNTKHSDTITASAIAESGAGRTKVLRGLFTLVIRSR